MTLHLPPPSRRALGSGDHGIAIVMVAMTIAAILVTVAMAMDLGGLRRDTQRNGIAADAMALAGADVLNHSGTGNDKACLAAWDYLKDNLNEAGAGSGPGCSTFLSACVATVAREVTTTVGQYQITFVNPVPDNHRLMGAQSLSFNVDGAPCKRFGVEIVYTRPNVIASGSFTSTTRAVAKLSRRPASVEAPLILLDPTGCNVLKVDGNAHLVVTTASSTQAWIAIDSDGSGCSGANKVVSTNANAMITSKSGTGEAGGVAMWALTGPNSGYAYDNADVAASITALGIWPRPTASSTTVTRKLVDFHYNCHTYDGCTGPPPYIDNLIAGYGGTGTPAGFTKWSDYYSCSISNDLIVPSGDWYVDCPAGLQSTGNGSITFRGGDIVTEGSVTVKDNTDFRVNCDVASHLTACPANPAAPTIFYLRHGTFSNTANNDWVMHETFVYLGDGTITRTANGTVDWTAPDDPSFEFDDLLLWTESTTAMSLGANASMKLEGIFFAPNMPVTMSGNAGTTALKSQMLMKTLTMVDNGTITLSPINGRSLDVWTSTSTLIR